MALLLFSTLLIAGCVNNPSDSPSTTPNSNGQASVSQASASASVSASGSVSADFLTYSNDVFKIGYPKDWTVREDGNVVLFGSPSSGADDAMQENVNVIVVPTDQTLEAFVQAALGQSVESAGFEVIDSKATTLSGKPAQYVVYSEQSAEAKLEYLQVISVSDGQAAIVTYTATASTFSEYKDEAEAMVSSFQLKSGPEASAAASVQALPPESSMAPDIVRRWRVYSEAIFYDEGGSNFLETPVTTLLEIRADQTWSFGSSSGTWSVQAIEESDWQKWGVPSYGPTRKLVLNGWNGGTNDGPIEESGSRVDFMWVIYRVGPPTVQSAGQIQMKFGWTNQQG